MDGDSINDIVVTIPEGGESAAVGVYLRSSASDISDLVPLTNLILVPVNALSWATLVGKFAFHVCVTRFSIFMCTRNALAQ